MVCSHPWIPPRSATAYSCLDMNFATTHLRLSTWPTMNGFGMPYFQLCHCLTTNGYWQQTARKKTTNDWKLLVWCRYHFWTETAYNWSVFHLRSYTGHHMQWNFYGSVVYDLQNATKPMNAYSLLTKKGTIGKISYLSVITALSRVLFPALKRPNTLMRMSLDCACFSVTFKRSLSTSVKPLCLLKRCRHSKTACKEKEQGAHEWRLLQFQGSLNRWLKNQKHNYQPPHNQEGKKEWLTSVPILCRITLQNVPYKDNELFVLMSFEVTTVTSMDSQELTCCDDGHLLVS